MIQLVGRDTDTGVLHLEVQRATDWIHNDRRTYWNNQVRRGWDRVADELLTLVQAVV